MKNWKFRYFEKNIRESHTHVFNSLEIKNYIRKFLLNNYGLSLTNYKLSFSNSTVNIHISIYEMNKQKIKNIKIKKKPNNYELIKKLMTVLTLKEKLLLKPYIFVPKKATVLSSSNKNNLKTNFTNLNLLINHLKKKKKK